MSHRPRRKTVTPKMLPTGHTGLDEALGGGVAKGRVIEVYGDDTRAFIVDSLEAGCAAQGGSIEAMLIDAEQAVRTRRASIVFVRDPMSACSHYERDHGIRARIVSRRLREITKYAAARSVTVVFDCPEVGVDHWGSIRNGLGNALRFYASQRVRVRKGIAKVMKNKFAAPFVTVDLGVCG